MIAATRRSTLGSTPDGNGLSEDGYGTVAKHWEPFLLESFKAFNKAGSSYTFVRPVFRHMTMPLWKRSQARNTKAT